jgi:hypothetical protein
VKLLARLGSAVLGFLTAAAAVALHDLVWALVLSWVATLLTVCALTPGIQGRLPYALGWMLAVGLAVWNGPSGGYLIGADTHGYLVLGLALVVLSAGIATIPLKRRRRLAGHDQRSGDLDHLAG